jgi:regulator of sigma E protease
VQIIDTVLGLLSTVVSFLVVITVVVTVHELGHFFAARLFKTRVDRFSIGFGPTLWARTAKSGVEWRIAGWPIGGYVKFSGDANAASVPDGDDLAELREEIVAAEGPGAEKNYYHFKPVWQRTIISLAGPAANFVLSIAIFTVLAWSIGVTLITPRVAALDPKGAAVAAGFKANDIILSLDGRPADTIQTVQQYVMLRSGEAIRFVVLRDGKKVALTSTPQSKTENDPLLKSPTKVGRLGIVFAPREDEVRRVHIGPVKAFGVALVQTREAVGTTVHYVGRIFRGRENGDQLGGPLSIFRTSGAVTKDAVAVEGSAGFKALNLLVTQLSFIAYISIGIGFLNLLPIPVLDGGHLLFYAYEAVARKPLQARIQAMGYQVGLALLLGLMLFATWNDIQKLSVFKNLGGLFS